MKKKDVCLLAALAKENPLHARRISTGQKSLRPERGTERTMCTASNVMRKEEVTYSATRSQRRSRLYLFGKAQQTNGDGKAQSFYLS